MHDVLKDKAGKGKIKLPYCLIPLFYDPVRHLSPGGRADITETEACMQADEIASSAAALGFLDLFWILSSALKTFTPDQ